MKRTMIRRAGWAAAALLALLAPRLLDNTNLNILNVGIIYAIAVLGLHVILGLTGQMSLAQAAFWGIGSYTSALLTTRLGLSPWAGLAAATLLAGLFGVVLGFPTSRLNGHYLAMATIGFGIIVGLVLLNWDELTGGADGIVGVPIFTLGPLRFDHIEKYYYLLLGMLALGAWGIYNLRRSRVGRGLLAIRENELAAEAGGVPTTAYKVLAFGLGASYAGLSGALFAHMPNLRYISPDTYSLEQSTMFLAMLVLGGSGSIAGGILGATFLNFLPEWLRFLASGYLAVYGAGIMLIMVFFPQGAIGLVERRVARWRQAPTLLTPAPDGVLDVGRPPEPSGGAAAAAEVVLELRNLHKHFGGIKAVDGVTFQVRRGAIHALIGPNGSGKSTVINLISGIYRPTRGEVIFAGRPIQGRPPHTIAAHGLARTFQNIRLFPELSVLENVMVGQHVRTRTGLLGSLLRRGHARGEEAAIQDQALAALAFVGLLDKQHDLAKNLAYGQQRRVEVARALAAQPTLLLLDEPAAGMNPAETEELIELLGQLHRRGLTILLIEHDMNLVMQLSDHITVLNFGKEIADGQPQQIALHPAVIEAYLGMEVVDA